MRSFLATYFASWRPRRRIAYYAALPLLVLVFMGSAPRANMSTNVIDVGVVPRGAILHESITVRNEGLRTLSIDSRTMRTCGVRVRDDRSARTLRHRTAVPLRLEIDTTSFPEGPSVREVRLPTNDPLRRSLLVTVRAYVRSDVSIEPQVLRLSPAGPEAVARVLIAPGSNIEPAGIRTTDRAVTAQLRREESAQGTVLVVTARTDARRAGSWNLGTIVVATNSETVPELRIPVRGIPLWGGER